MQVSSNKVNQMKINKASFSDRQHKVVKNFLQNVGNRYVYGRTNEAKSVAALLDIDGYIDDFTNEKTFLGKPVLKLNELPENACVLSTVVQAFAVSALKKLEASGHSFVDYFAFKVLSELTLPEIPYWVGAKEHFESNLQEYQAVYDALSDDESRDVFERVMSFRLNYDISQMYCFTANLQGMYFEPFLNVQSDNPVFYDIGAYDGYNSDHFSRLYPSMQSAVLFEPIPDQAEKLRQKYDDNSQFAVHELALSDHEGEVRFNVNSTASRITDSDEGICIQTTTLDAFFKAGGLRPDILKMDIEGAEISALKGAKNLIRDTTPNLAVSVYHAASHLTEAFRLISNMHPHYKYYLRHYTEGYTETVLFAVP